MQLRRIGVVLFIIGAILIMIVPLPAQNQTQLNSNTTVVKHGLNETELQNEFQRIASLPYEEYKCRQKSNLLWNYIHTNDPNSAVYTVSIQHKSGKYAHVYVVYEGMVFDPTSEPALYRIPMDKYNRQLDAWSFDRNYLVSTGTDGSVV